MSEGAAEVTRARRFELVDSEGRVRATLGLDEEGSPAVCLCDEEGNVRGGLCITSEGVPQLRMMTAAGGLRAALGFGTSWRPGLVLTDRHGVVIWSAQEQF